MPTRDSLRHPNSAVRHLNRWKVLVFAWLVGFGGLTGGICAERGVSLPLPRAPLPVRPSQPPAQPPRGRQRPSYVDGFLVKGTVFTEQGFALPDAELRIRRTNEKKYRWTVRTDRRGEFAIRVPKSANYEISVKARGYQEQKHAVDAKAGEGGDGLIFRMSQSAGGKSK